MHNQIECRLKKNSKSAHHQFDEIEHRYQEAKIRNDRLLASAETMKRSASPQRFMEMQTSYYNVRLNYLLNPLASRQHTEPGKCLSTEKACPNG